MNGVDTVMAASRVNVSFSPGLYDKIEAYAELMGLSMSEACRHLVIKGVEQVQALSNAKDSVDALNRMTKSLDRQMKLEEEFLKVQGKQLKAPVKKSRKARGGLVTPPQSDKNGTDSTVKDIFE